MEAFSLLKYWRNSGVASVSGTTAGVRNGTTTRTKTILTAVSHHDTDTDEDYGDGDGPFFDLELALPEEDGDEGTNHEEEDGDNDEAMESDGEIEREIKLSISPVSTGDCTESDEKTEVSPPKSASAAASKFRVLILKLRKSIPTNAAEKSDPNGSASTTPKQPEKKSSAFTLKFKIEEVFTRGNKSSSDESVAAEEKRFSKEAIEKYLKKVKPLYIRVSKRYVEKIRFSGQLTAVGSEKEPDMPSEPSPPAIRTAKSQKQGNFPAGLRVVCKHLGKSRSASSVAAPVPAKRCDDSFLQQQDGIQSAILHCKRSFNSSSTDEADSESSVLWRSGSDSSSSHEKSSNGSEGVAKETSI